MGLAMAALVAGCSHDDGYVSPTESAIDTYQKIFVENFGTPAPNQTWGFGSDDASDVAASRVRVTRGSSPNANMWGGDGLGLPEGSYNQPYIVPDPLTEAQKDKARRWFQSHKQPRGVALHYTDFFVQQVYKGHTNLDGAPDDCKEEYTAGNGQTVIGANQLDYLMAGPQNPYQDWQGNTAYSYDHIFNFNNADYSGGVANVNVWDGSLDSDASKDFNDRKIYHPDQIMLLLNSSTESFGYHNSATSMERHDKYVIISGDEIQRWDNRTRINGQDADVSGMWFVGFDFEGALPTDPWFNEYNTNTFLIQPNSSDDPNAVEIKNRDGFKAVIGGADGYYSDWIVRITPGVRRGGSDTPTTPDPDENETWGNWKRIICEDLSVSQRSDFDFNDVVFDARINTAKTKAQIRLKAAGGTLPLTVGWSGDAGTSYNEYEVHNMYGVATNIMVNTHAKNGVDGKADVEKTLTGSFKSFNDIKIMVQKRGEWMEIMAKTGEPAAKLAVDTDYEWCDELQNITNKYSNFDDYVQDATLTDWWRAVKK